MLKPVKIMDIELSHKLVTIAGIDGYKSLQAIIRLHGTPVGYITVPVINGCCTALSLSKVIAEQQGQAIIHHIVSDRLVASSQQEGLQGRDLFNIPHPTYNGHLPLVTIAVCTRNRTADLARCLDSLNCLDYPALDILIVDNAPSDDTTKQLIHTRYSNVRYICEPRPGLDWARNRAILEARGDIIAYTDDDVVVDPGWIKALATVFAENPEVMAVTGLVVPYELETEAQILFERYGGFTRGFICKRYRAERNSRMQLKTYYGNVGQFGTGANMAYRRSLFDKIGYFDPALDVGTATNGGGDLEMFFRVLKEGYTLFYEPNALVRHCHRQTFRELKNQITSWGTGFIACIVRCAAAYPDERFSLLRLWSWWLRRKIRSLLLSFVRPAHFQRSLILTELWGAFIGPYRYLKARYTARAIMRTFGAVPPVSTPKRFASEEIVPGLNHQNAIAVRSIELNQPLHALTDVTDYPRVRIFVRQNDCPIGSIDIVNHYQPVTEKHLQETISEKFAIKLLKPILIQHLLSLQDRATEDTSAKLPNDISVSVVVATYDRPDNLRNCLQCLLNQKSQRYIEIIVVDNNPSSGLTPPVVSEFPDVILVNELRKGLAYARNAGFIASRGDIVVATDDDVTLPREWLEKLIAPFSQADVMAVTGNVLPIELETDAQHLFEIAGGLGRGFELRVVNGDWFKRSRKAVPTWDLGATANAAFRAAIFSHPDIGLMDETLGPGMHSGAGEDAYLFYKILKANYTIVYEPAAYVWHKHRRDMAGLRRQIYNYNKGHVAYLLTTLFNDRDFRAIVRLVYELPKGYYWYIKQRLRRKIGYPLPFIFLEILGHLAGPWSFLKSQYRVKREGRSGRYIPVLQRPGREEKLFTAANNI
ncbi:MAG: glycosyltransferase [wastewater metagenome]|nr:glycosyltransferase [Candidatus Loosdrechtia aerotolerans]